LKVGVSVIKSDNSSFRKRTITTIIAVPIVVAFIWFDQPVPWFTLFAAGWGIGAAYEFYRLVARSGRAAPLTYFGLLWVTLFIVSPHLEYVNSVPLLLTGMVILPLVILLWRTGKKNAFANWAWTVAGVLYIGWLLSYMVALRNLEDGRAWIFLAMFCTFASDISAYLVGRTFGKHKMALYISPNKTWEGSLGGIIGAMILSLLIVWGFPVIAGVGTPVNYIRPISYGGAAILGLLISVAGQTGDLVKSLFKRNTGAKDSSQAIPGHGGFLDRMDSQAFAGLAAYLYVFYLVLGR
jgi:phosphatidate cytidylyltransferase